MKPTGAQLLAAATLAVERAASFLLGQEGRMRPADWTAKGRSDFVTEVDRESERIVAGTLLEAFPGSMVMGEELSPLPSGLGTPASGPILWIVDPLDGTTNFLHRFPCYAVSIAALVDGVLEAGCVRHVPPGITYTAVRGGGARQDDEPIACSVITGPEHALIGTGFPFSRMDQLALYQRQFAAIAAATAGIRRPGSAALDLCDVAAGRFDGFWELRLAPWDVAAGTLLVREAGGLVTDLAGNPDVLGHSAIVAGNPAIHEWLLETLGGGRGET
jgi:myo-inositol-1(or 4)-monophosphatase